MKNKLNDIWSKITYWHRRKFRQIKNVIGWIPVIWKQFDFDYHYSLDVFKHQLLKQAKFMESDKAYGMNSHIQAQKIRMVVRLMDKVYDEEYALEYQQKLKDSYGDDVMDLVLHDLIDSNECHPIVWKFEEDKKYESLREEIRENYDKWFKESQAKQERAHKLLWKLIEFYIRGWWD